MDDAQTCLKRLNKYSQKHEFYENEVKECQIRNTRNSDRNNELREQMGLIQKKLNKFTTEKI